MKLLIILGLGVIFWFMLTGRWPWESAAAKAEARARSLLGVGKSAAREEVIEAHRKRLAMVHPDRGGTNEQVHEANAARDLLLARISARQETT